MNWIKTINDAIEYMEGHVKTETPQIPLSIPGYS